MCVCLHLCMFACMCMYLCKNYLDIHTSSMLQRIKTKYKYIYMKEFSDDKKQEILEKKKRIIYKKVNMQ